MGKILICGGAGYIGSHCNKMLAENGYETVVFDNLVYGHREEVKWGELVVGDLNDPVALKKLFDEISPKYADRKGGYTKIIKIGPRRGDAAEMAIIQLV